jgi:DNA-binding CsgD family transcriptional regulator
MVVLAPKLHSQIEAFERLNHSEKQLRGARYQHSKQPSLLEAIIEGFVDGILILSEQGEWIHANEGARRICQKLSQRTSTISSVPQPIWRVCESAIDSRTLFPDRQTIIESEFDIDDSETFRVRVRWLELNESDRPYLLVTIEDKHQSAHNVAIAEAKRYGLTPREAEVWLLRRANYSYKDIAAKLFITPNTVKKHLKNIYTKQEAIVLPEDEE